MINQAIRCKHKHIARAISALPIFFTLGMQSLVHAQSIIPSNGMGTIVSPNGDIRGGQTAGSNQFHTFTRFNVDAGERANFITDENIQNVLGRVTGGEPSSINGLIQLTGSNANLYLINPTGIIIGPDAQLDVPSSFFVTTADHLRFGENLLDVYNSIDLSELTGNPTSFIFSLDRVGAIVNLGELRVSSGDLALLGGTVISTGSLLASEGRIIITAVEGGNEVNISQSGSLLTLSIQRADILNNYGENIIPTTSLPELLTGSDFSDEASELVVKEDGSVWLASSSDETESSGIELDEDGIIYVDYIYSGEYVTFLCRNLINNQFWAGWRPDVTYRFPAKDLGLVTSISTRNVADNYSQYFIFQSIFLEFRELSLVWSLQPLFDLEAQPNVQNVSISSDPIQSHTAGQSLNSRIETQPPPNFSLLRIDLDSLNVSELPEIHRSLNSKSKLESGPSLDSQPMIRLSDFRVISEEIPPDFESPQIEFNSLDVVELSETSSSLDNISGYGLELSNSRTNSEMNSVALIIERNLLYRDGDILLPFSSLDNSLIFNGQETNAQDETSQSSNKDNSLIKEKH